MRNRWFVGVSLTTVRSLTFHPGSPSLAFSLSSSQVFGFETARSDGLVAFPISVCCVQEHTVGWSQLVRFLSNQCPFLSFVCTCLYGSDSLIPFSLIFRFDLFCSLYLVNLDTLLRFNTFVVFILLLVWTNVRGISICLTLFSLIYFLFSFSSSLYRLSLTLSVCVYILF